MQLVVAEKPIAGKRIAELLSDNGSTTLRGTPQSPVYLFSRHGQPGAVVSLKGHVMELEFPSQYNNWHGTPLPELVKAPIEYKASFSGLPKTLREYAGQATEIVIATDADREGESIGVEAVTLAGLSRKDARLRRAYFSAIVKKDVETAWGSLTPVDFNLADAADARREIDLIWGAVLTRFISLSSKRTGKDFLSVGRVQTPTLRLIVDRQKEINAFKPETYWEILGTFDKNGEIFEAQHEGGKFSDHEKVKAIVSKKPTTAKVTSVKQQEKVVKRPVPFNTTEFLASATKLGFSAGAAMQVAESLYMAGFISYPRTDSSAYPASLNLKEILEELQKGPFAKDAQKILQKPLNPSRGKETQDHPPIHPVTAARKEQLDARQWKVYELVVRRFLATLSDDARVLATTAKLDALGEIFVANGQVILHKGWKDVYPYSQLNENELPKLVQGDVVKVVGIKEWEKQTQPPARYSQGALIKLMEQLGLGTKATRAEIIQKLLHRGYVNGSKMLEPAIVSFAVIDALVQHAPLVTQAQMTASIENRMDEVAAGKVSKETVVNQSRTQLMEVVEELLSHRDAISVQLRSALLSEKTYGTCGVCGTGHLRELKGKTGKRFVGCSNYPQCMTTYPLPQKGRITPLGTKCGVCQSPMVRVISFRRKSEYCLNFSCSTKSDWKKKEPKAESLPPQRKPKKPSTPKKVSAKPEKNTL